MRASALASTCSSLLLALVAVAGEPPPDPGTVATLEIEARLARKPDLYLVVRAPDRKLEIKARGVLLDSVPLSGVEVVAPRRMLGEPSPRRLEVPAVLVVKDGPGDLAREVIAPQELKDMPGEDEEEEPTTGPTAPPATPTPIPEAPFSYRAELDNGWDIWVCEKLPGAGLLTRLRTAASDGWARLWGRAESYRPALTLAMSREDAQRIFHLFNTDRTILIAAGP
jgi:hypothetical protein